MMNEKERWNLAAKAADSIIDSFTTSVRRAVALFGTPKDALEKLILPEIETTLGADIVTVIGKGRKTYEGETRDIAILLSDNDDPYVWYEVMRRMSVLAKQGRAAMFHPGDFITIPVNVPKVEIDGYTFDAVDIESTKIIVTAAYSHKIALNFENVIFQAPVNKEYTNKGGFKASLLARCLNEHFLPSVFKEVESLLKPNCDGLKVSVPTYPEVFGNDREGYDATNWCEVGEKIRHPYFEKCTNRIKVREDDLNDTWWYWLSSPHAGSATNFCAVGYSGLSGTLNASVAAGGVAPAICIS